MNYEAVIDEIISREKGYVDHPSDTGGPTKDGITTKTARAYGWNGPMQDLPDSVIRAIYRDEYIIDPKFDMVVLIDERVGFELIDTGVNMGQSRAATFFQRLLNALNLRGTKYPDIEVDGQIGDETLAAFRKYRRWRGTEGGAVMMVALNCLQGEKYLEFTENRETQEDFFYGWLRSRVYDQLKGVI